MANIDALRQQLLQQRALLFRQVTRAEDDLRWLDTNVEPELTEEGQEKSIALVLSRLDEHGKMEITAIDRALARIADGNYGRCASCGHTIADARLAALPAAELCLPCARSREGGK